MCFAVRTMNTNGPPYQHKWCAYFCLQPIYGCQLIFTNFSCTLVASDHMFFFLQPGHK